MKLILTNLKEKYVCLDAVQAHYTNTLLRKECYDKENGSVVIKTTDEFNKQSLRLEIVLDTRENVGYASLLSQFSEKEKITCIIPEYRFNCENSGIKNELGSDLTGFLRISGQIKSFYVGLDGFFHIELSALSLIQNKFLTYKRRYIDTEKRWSEWEKSKTEKEKESKNIDIAIFP